MELGLNTDNSRNAANSTWRQQANERKNRMGFLLGCLLGLLVSLPAMAEEILIPLQKLTPHPLIKLKCIGDESSLEIPISDRWNIKKVTLNLHYISSISMIGDLSQLVIKINDVPIAQVKLNPLMPDALLAVNVPAQYLKPGYNRLGFMVAQRYSTTGCENPCAPGLWTDISMQNSSLQVEYELNPVPLKLSSIAKFLFDPKTYPEAHVNIITEDRSAENLTLAAIIASGVARHYDYRKVTFGVARQIKPGVDNIVIGRTAFMQQFLGPYQLSLGEVKGGYLKVFPLPTADGTDNTHALVTVTGENFDHVKMAALTFTNGHL